MHGALRSLRSWRRDCGIESPRHSAQAAPAPTFHVRNRSGDLEDALVRARGELELGVCAGKELFGSFVRRAILLDEPRVHLRVDEDAVVFEPLTLALPCAFHPCANFGGRLSPGPIRKFAKADLRHLDLDVDAVKQRAECARGTFQSAFGSSGRDGCASRSCRRGRDSLPQPAQIPRDRSRLPQHG